MRYNLTFYECSVFELIYGIVNTELTLGIFTLDQPRPSLTRLIEKDICSRVLSYVESRDKFIAQYVNLTYEEVCSTIQLFREITNEV